MSVAPQLASQRLQLLAETTPRTRSILSPEALAFVADVVDQFRGRVDELLALRVLRQARYDRGQLPDFLEGTREIRENDWKVAPVPSELLDRRVEITGPVDRKMIINALNSGANVFMADFEDSNAPTFENCIEGQVNLFDAVRGTISYDDPTTGRAYRLQERTAILMVRPRGWHLVEQHLELDGEPVPAALFDFALFFFHNAQALIDRGSAPYFYLPKLQSYIEARLWNDLFEFAQAQLGIPSGTIKATVLIETLPAAFQMHEILWELRNHSAGLNCGRWDYIFSFIKTTATQADAVLPDRQQLTMLQPFLRAYSRLLIQTCHRRGVHAMGGMAAQIPIKGDEAAHRAAIERVRADKRREVEDGHDGTWVAHPALVAVAREVFDAAMPGPHQQHRALAEFSISAADLLRLPTGARTEAGLRTNIRVAIQYLEAWLRGQGCVPLYDLMEDAATAEISRTQIWQWIHHQARLDDGRLVSRDLFQQLLEEEVALLRSRLGDVRLASRSFHAAIGLLRDLCCADRLAEFLTLPAYELLLAAEQQA